MITMENINSMFMPLNDLDDFIRYFNMFICRYGAVRVMFLIDNVNWKNVSKRRLIQNLEAEDYNHGWTRTISDDDFEPYYLGEEKRFPRYVRLNLPNYENIEN